MILVDTSGLLTALNERQPLSTKAREILNAAETPPVLSPFVLAEVDYFIARRAGLGAELRFLAEVAAGAYRLAEFEAAAMNDAVEVIQQYGDLAIGLADASIVVLAGRYRTNRVLTLDERHFRAMRTPSGERFLVLPADA